MNSNTPQAAQTKTFDRKYRKNKHSFTDRITIKRTPSTLSALRIKRDRWFDRCHEQVTEVFEVEVTVAMVVCREDGTEYPPSANPYVSKYTEIVTPLGRGCVASGELLAFVTNGHALLSGCYVGRKYGMRRGSAIAYIMALGFSPDSRKKVSERCAAALYGAVNGESEKWSIGA